MGKQNKNKRQAVTPQPSKSIQPSKLVTPKSAPPPKRKKLSEEIEEELSDNDFEELLMAIQTKEKQKKQKGRKSPAKKEESEEELDSDDSDDDIDSDEMEEASSDDDENVADSDEADSDEEDGDSDEDEEESEEEVPVKKKNKKEKKALVNGEAKKGFEAKGIDKIAAQKDVSALAERNKRTLFIKPLPSNATEESIQKLSKDIIDVQFRISKKGNHRVRGLAYVHFKDEATTKKNYKKLLNKKIGDVQITVVDFVGEKSVNKKTVHEDPADFDPLRLYVGSLGREISEKDLKSVFKNSINIHLPMRKKNQTPMGFAFVAYDNEEAAKAAHDKMAGKKIKGRPMIVMFARKIKVEKQPAAKAVKRPAPDTKNENARKGDKKKEATTKTSEPAAKKKKMLLPPDSSEDEEDGDVEDSDGSDNDEHAMDGHDDSDDGESDDNDSDDDDDDDDDDDSEEEDSDDDDSD